MSSYHQATEYFEIIFNKTKYDSLPQEQQAILKYAAEAASTANFATAMDNYSNDLRLQTSAGVNLSRTDPSILKAQLDAWDKVLPGLMEDPFFAKVVESQKALGEAWSTTSCTTAPTTAWPTSTISARCRSDRRSRA